MMSVSTVRRRSHRRGPASSSTRGRATLCPRNAPKLVRRLHHTPADRDGPVSTQEPSSSTRVGRTTWPRALRARGRVRSDTVYAARLVQKPHETAPRPRSGRAHINDSGRAWARVVLDARPCDSLTLRRSEARSTSASHARGSGRAGVHARAELIDRGSVAPRGPGLSEPEVGFAQTPFPPRGSFGIATKPRLGHGVAGPTLTTRDEPEATQGPGPLDSLNTGRLAKGVEPAGALERIGGKSPVRYRSAT